MRRILAGLGCAALLTGCNAFSELTTDVPCYALVDGDEEPMASFVVCNVSFRLFYFIPLISGETWKTPDFENESWFNVGLFEDRATLDENLASVHAALRRCRSNRVANLVSTIDDSSKWSLFIFRRRLVKTTCLILKPTEESQTGR